MNDASCPVTLTQEEALLARELAVARNTPYAPSILSSTFRFVGPLNVAALNKALNALVARHDGLRTVFFPAEDIAPETRQSALMRYGRTGYFTLGMHRQAIVAEVPMPVPFVDLSPFSLPAIDHVFRSICNRELRTEFENASPPRVRAVLLKMAENDHLLVTCLDHLVGDVWSLRVIRQDLVSLYSLFVEPSRTVPLAPPKMSSTQYAVWQHQKINEGYFDRAARYWRDQWMMFGSHRISASSFPFARATPNRASLGVDIAEVILDLEVSARVRQVAQRSRITCHMLFVAAYCIVLQCITGKDKLAIWTHLANRSNPGACGAVGWFDHSHLLGVEVDPDTTVREVFSEVRRRVADACAMSELPLGLLWQMLECHPVFSDARALIDFIPEDLEDEVALQGGTTISTVDTPSLASGRFSEVGVYVTSRKGRFRIAANLSLARFSQGAAESLLREVIYVIQQVVTEPVKKISEFGLAAMPRMPARKHASGSPEMQEYLLLGEGRLPRLDTSDGCSSSCADASD